MISFDPSESSTFSEHIPLRYFFEVAFALSLQLYLAGLQLLAARLQCNAVSEVSTGVIEVNTLCNDERKKLVDYFIETELMLLFLYCGFQHLDERGIMAPSSSKICIARIFGRSFFPRF